MIATELGLRPLRTTDQVFLQVAQQLSKSQRPLLVDEADHILNDRSIEAIRKLHDVSGVPVILMGEENLPQRLQRWERVHSRMLSWVPVEDATTEDVDHLARIYARGVTLGPALKAAILRASKGSIRNASTNLAYVKEFAVVRGLTSLDLAEWGSAAFHTGEAPAPRLTPRIVQRKGAAA